jgi:hypothetical protein
MSVYNIWGGKQELPEEEAIKLAIHSIFFGAKESQFFPAKKNSLTLPKLVNLCFCFIANKLIDENNLFISILVENSIFWD